MKIATLCTRRVAVIDPGARVVEAAVRMREEHVGTLVVVEGVGDKLVPVGILTDRDIVVSVVARAVDDLPSLRIEDIVTRTLVVARLDDDAMIVARRMRENGVRRLPVVDDRGELCGIVTADDLLGGIHAELSELAHLVAHQPRQEAAARP